MKFENLKETSKTASSGTRVPFPRSDCDESRGSEGVPEKGTRVPFLRVPPIVVWCWGVAVQVLIAAAVAAAVAFLFRALIFWVLF